ncbi:putative NRDE-2, necessary for RNA interference-domain-containing protein [Seiridium cardinale]
MSSTGGTSVPKFGSFKKKPEPTLAPGKDQRHEKTRYREDGGGRKRDRSHEQHTQSTATSPVRLSERTDSDVGSPREHKLKLSQRSLPPRRPNDELFTIDSRGDPLIRRYGGNDRYKVPAYRRFGGGRLLGTNGFFRIDRSGNREQFFLRGYGEGGSELSRNRSSVLAKAGREQSGSVRVRKVESETVTGDEDFLPLKQSRKRKRADSRSDGSAAENGPSYRSIHGMSKKHENSDSDEDYGSDSASELDTTAANDPITMKNIELTARVKEHPEDTDAWIELVEHQDNLRDLHSWGGYSATHAEIKSYAEIKLSLLEKALKHTKTAEQTTSLRLRTILEGSKVWDSKTANQRWEELMLDHGTNFEIWNAYVTFRQTNLTTFTYDNMKLLYVSKLRLLEKEVASQNSDADKRTVYEQLIVVFSRVTHFIADAGYTELATAVWQAVLELHFHRPAPLVDVLSEAALSSLQIFWESEAPRIGDEHAKGWATFDRDGGMQDPPEPRSFDNGEPLNTRDPYKAWAAIEKHKAEDSRVPARTMDDGTEDDPYRVIMYADIEDLLFFVPTNSLSLVQEPLLDAFLNFCRLPSVFGSSTTVRTILRDEAFHGSGSTYLTIGGDTKQHDTENDGIKHPEFSYEVQMITKTAETMFPSQRWFRYIECLRQSIPPEQYSFVSNVLKQLTFSFRNENLEIYYLSFDSTNNISSSKKVAKALLKQDPSHIDLYIGFAKSEFAKGSKEAARNVASAALRLTGLALKDRLRLCMTLAWMELDDGQLKQASLQLCQVSGDAIAKEVASPAQMLKIRQLLAGNRDHLLSSRDPNSAMDYAEAAILLEYITRASGKESQSSVQGDIWSAMVSVNACSGELISRGFSESAAHERLLQFAAQLLYYHASHGPYRPAFFRECIEKYVQLFPKNTIFLSLYAWREERLGIEDRVRAILDKTVLTKDNDCLSSRIFAIRHEMAVGNAHSTRAAFERAIESDVCKHHIGIWISYIRYCHWRKELRSKAKDVFYRAIQSCPWSKGLFMEAFVTLLTDMDSSELRSVYNTLCDKGLRVHLELDEFAENWKKAQKK